MTTTVTEALEVNTVSMTTRAKPGWAVIDDFLAARLRAARLITTTRLRQPPTSDGDAPAIKERLDRLVRLDQRRLGTCR